MLSNARLSLLTVPILEKKPGHELILGIRSQVASSTGDRTHYTIIIVSELAKQTNTTRQIAIPFLCSLSYLRIVEVGPPLNGCV